MFYVRSTHQLVIMDIILGQSVLVEKPMETGDEVVGVCFAREKRGGGGGGGKVQQQQLVVAFNSKYFRVFAVRGGDHVSSQSFPLGLSDVLRMRFFADVDTFVSVHWSGDMESHSGKTSFAESRRQDFSEFREHVFRIEKRIFRNQFWKPVNCRICYATTIGMFLR